MSLKRTKQAEICFVIDATKSMDNYFRGVCDHVIDTAMDFRIRYRRYQFCFSAVIYHDPIDYKIPPSSNELTEDILEKIKKIDDMHNEIRIRKLEEEDLYDANYEGDIQNHLNNIDRSKYPPDKNIAIQFKSNVEELILQLEKVEFSGGNDEPEDWVGALNIALHEIEWSENAKKCIVWISDSNAHGKRFCGYDNHNEEEVKMEPLVREMAENDIRFIGFNFTRKGVDDGCAITLNEMKKIYRRYANSSKFICREIPVGKSDDDWPVGIEPAFSLPFDFFSD